LIKGIGRSLKAALDLAESVAAGDLTQAVKIESTDEIGRLLVALNKMNESLVTIVGVVHAGTETIATGSSQIAAGNTDLSSRTEQQASSLEETASSMDQVTQQNAALVEQASAAAQSLQDQAGRLAQAVGVFKLDNNQAPRADQRKAGAIAAGQKPRSMPSAAARPPALRQLTRALDWEQS
jgi:methyl-accepting chemotaxis protein